MFKKQSISATSLYRCIQGLPESAVRCNEEIIEIRFDGRHYIKMMNYIEDGRVNGYKVVLDDSVNVWKIIQTADGKV